MTEKTPPVIYRKDYRPPAFLVDETRLEVSLFDEGAEVVSRLSMRRNPAADFSRDLVLDGIDLELREVSLDGQRLAKERYQVKPASLVVLDMPDAFELSCTTWIKPQENTRLEGLYQSSGMFCTQCEAEGFRRITYYPDRPDVMARFVTRIEADKARFPVLLSNGNEIDRGALPGGRHFACWQDPFPKPCYLFALVAGDLHCQEDAFVTASGRTVALKMFVDPHNRDKCDFAMGALKRAMAWDETVYGREYDLDIFMIVAVDDFNMGAMENKGLNIFNSSCVLASPETTTDLAFQRIEAIIAHEYFHNWSGNRVTCRDWFQLSLKEGFTVFRDACFSADMGSATVKRIAQVNLLRTVQFAEDAGPMAHPVRPDSFIEISNFYTVTIYEKGSEVVSMIHTLLGPDAFRKGTDLYFERHDGQAVTTDDFVRAMEDASGVDLSQFRRWYSQAGTPVVTAEGHYDKQHRRYVLTLSQETPPTPDQPEKQPFHIPVAVGLLGPDGQSLPLVVQEQEAGDGFTSVLSLTRPSQQYVFEQVPVPPTPSLLRRFSAPVRLNYEYDRDQLALLMKHDVDGFNRWDAGQKLAVSVLQQMMDDISANREPEIDPRLLSGFKSLLTDENVDPAMAEKMLELPSEAYLCEIASVVRIEVLHRARQWLQQHIGQQLEAELAACYERLNDPTDRTRSDGGAMGRRALRNRCLRYLACAGSATTLQVALDQYRDAANMTDGLAALGAVVHNADEPQQTEILDDFYQRWQHDALVINDWLVVQATNPQPGGLQRVQSLMQHPAFDLHNPNKVRSLIGAFCQGNLVNFHDASGSGYRFLADQVMVLDRLNPQIASRLLTPLTRFRKFEASRQALMRQALSRILDQEDLSSDVYEVVAKSLEGAGA